MDKPWPDFWTRRWARSRNAALLEPKPYPALSAGDRCRKGSYPALSVFFVLGFKIYLMASKITRHCVTTFIFMLWLMVSELMCGGVIIHISQCSFIPQCSKERAPRVASRPLLSGFKVAQRLLPGRWKVHRLFWLSAPAFAPFTFRRT